MEDCEVSFRIGAEKTRENLFCFFGLGNTGLMGDFETDIGLASSTTAVESSSMRSSSSEKWTSELAPLLSVSSRSVRIGSTRPLRFWRLLEDPSSARDLSEKVLPTGDFSAGISFGWLIEYGTGSVGGSGTTSVARRSCTLNFDLGIFICLGGDTGCGVDSGIGLVSCTECWISSVTEGVAASSTREAVFETVSSF